MARKPPSEDDHREALHRLLSGLASDTDLFDLVSSVADLHPKNDTFPGEVFMGLAADTLELVGATRQEPIRYEGLRENFLPECTFRGRENRKIQYALLTAASLRGGLDPDLLHEVIWWNSDDYWRYALFAVVAVIRAGAQRQGVPVARIVEQLAERHDLDLR
jgi:hypothetical protein